MRKLLLGGSGMAACMANMGVFAPALAAQESAAEEDANVIIVTARRIAEGVEDTPVAVSVLDGDTLDNLVVDETVDLVRQIPSASFVSGGPAFLADISIRGQGAGRQGFSESATGIYRNGFYIAGGGFGGRSFNRLDLFDVRAVETYRGPQAALYGRNAVGGAVNVITNAPRRNTLEGRVRARYEDVDRFDIDGVLNLPLGENFAARLGGFYSDQDDGFYTDVNTGEAVDFQSHTGLRGALRGWIGERTDITLTLEHYSNETPSFSALGERLPVNNGGLPVPGAADPGPFERNADTIGRVDLEETSVFAELASNLDFADLDIVFSYKTRDAERFDDDLDHFLGFQGVGGTMITVTQAEDFERFGGEVRLSSKEGGRWQWLIGADFQTFDDDVRLANAGSSSVPSLAALATRSENFVEELTSFSAFGLVGFDLTERLNLAVEARLIRDEKDFVFVRQQSGATVIDTGDLNEKETRFLPAATLRYELTDASNLYLRFATGYRPFGFNTGVPSEDFVPYEGELARSYEIGWKGSLFDNRLRYALAGFYMTTDDPQLVTAISTTDTSTALQNVSGSEVYGLEAELDWTFPVWSGRLTGGFRISTIDGEFDDGTSILSSVEGVGIVEFDLSGARVPRTRDVILSFDSFYNVPLSEGLNLFFGGSLQAEDGGFENAIGDSPTRFDSGIPNTAFAGRSLDGFLLVDARIGLSGEWWRISAYGANITDEVYVLQNVLQNNFYNQPARYGVQASVTF